MSDHTPRAKKSTENIGRPASTYSDFYIRTLFQPGLADTQYNVLTFAKLVNTAIFSFFALSHKYRAIDQLLSRPSSTHYLNLTSNFVVYCNSFLYKKTVTFVNLVNLL